MHISTQSKRGLFLLLSDRGSNLRTKEMEGDWCICCQSKVGR